MKLLKLIIFYLIIIGLFCIPNFTFGATLSDLADDLSSLKANDQSNHTIEFKTPSGAGDITDTITVELPVSFTIGSTDFGDIDLSHGSSGTESEEILADSATATAWEASFTGLTLTLTHPTNPANGDIAPLEIVIVEIGTNASGGLHQIENGSAGNYNINIAGTFGDTGQIPIVVLANNQIQAEGSVVATIAMSMSSSTTSFGTIEKANLGEIRTASPNITITITTNHANGYSIMVSDIGDGARPGLFLSSDQFIGSANSNFDNTVDLNSVIAGYGIQAVCTAGCQTSTNISSKYQLSGANVAGLKITAELLASYSGYMTSAHTIEITHKVKTSQYLRTGSYLDQITYLATANY